MFFRCCFSFSKFVLDNHSMVILIIPPGPMGIKLFFMFNSAEHEISSTYKSKISSTYNSKNTDNLGRFLDVVFIMLMNVKMQKIVGI